MSHQLPLVISYHPILSFSDVVKCKKVEVQKILGVEVEVRLGGLFFLITIKFVFNHVCLKRAWSKRKRSTFHGGAKHVLAEDK